MSRLKTILLFLFCTITLFGFSQEKIQPNEAVTKWYKIDSIIQSLDIPSNDKIGHFLEFQIGSEPDIDCFDPSCGMILSDVSKEQSLILVNHYQDYTSDTNEISTAKKNQEFLTDTSYSIQFDSITERGKIVHFSCLIYDDEKYLHFMFGK